MAINTYFQNIANAIRTKTGSAGLITPADMPDEILNIPAGGSRVLTPIYTDLNKFYVSRNGAYLYEQITVINRNDIYLIEQSGHYILFKGGSNIGNRFRAGVFSVNMGEFVNYTNDEQIVESGGLPFTSDDELSQSAFSIRFNSAQSVNAFDVMEISSQYIGKYLTITKNNTGNLGDKIYVVRLEDLIGG